MPTIESVNEYKDLPCLLYDCSRLLRRRIEERISSLGLTDAQWRLVGLLGVNEGLTQTDLAALMGIQKVPLGEHIDKLERLGWVERRRDSVDRRANSIYIKADAKPRAELINRRFIQLADHITASFSEDKWRQLQLLLRKLVSGFVDSENQLALSHLKIRSHVYLISFLARQLGRQFDSSLKLLGSSRTQWLVIGTLRHCSGISQSELSRLLDMSKAPLGQILDQLVEKKWLRREQDPSDKRQKRLIVDESSAVLLDHFEGDYLKIHRHLSDQLSVLETQNLQEYLHKICQLLRSLDGDLSSNELLYSQ